MKKLFVIFASIFICGILFAQTKNAAQKNLGVTNIDIAKLANATNDKNAPVVYFSREISSESILKLYKATGKKLFGKIALKVIFEGPREQYLDPALLTDSCSDAKPLGNIGVLASTDPVAIDRAACDMTFGQGTPAQTKKWEELHGVTAVLNAAEKIGVGKQKYRIVEVK